MSAKTYLVYNDSLCTTAAPVKKPTGNAIRTMLVLKPAVIIRPIAWGVSFDGSAAATPGEVELIETDVGISGSNITDFATADIQTYGDANAPANSAGNAGGTAGSPLNLSSSGAHSSCFTNGAPTEGAITVTRMADLQQIAPTNQYVLQWPLAREFECIPGRYLRVRMTFPSTVNAYCFIIFEV